VRGGESDYVKVLVDGVPMNEPGGAYDFAHLTLDNVDRIEVLRGPGSVLYGSDAVSGVVQVFTRAGGRQLEAGARAGLVAPDEKDAYMNIPLERRRPALEAMKAAGVRAVFAGHLHANAHGMDGTLEMVTTGPVGKPLKKDPSGLRIVEVREDGLKHRYYALDEVPEKVDLR